MTTQYTPTLKLALPVTGELSGTWGDTVNDNITSMIEQAIAGLSTINTWTANAHTLTTANGTTSESRCAMLVAATGGGAPTAVAEIICPAAAKLYVLQNNTAFAVTLKTSAGTGIAVAAGNTAFLFCDGTNVNACVTTIIDGRVTGNLTVDGNATINGNTTLGNATTDTITATARFNTDLVPSTDNARDLGSVANSWKDLYIDGTATMALVAISGGTINGVSIGATTAATLINVDNLRLDGNTLSSTNTDGNVVIAPNGTGDVQLDADTVRVGDAAAAATLTSNGAGALTVTTGGAANLTLSTNSGTTSGTVVIANGANGNITLAPDGTGDVILSADRTQIGDSNTDALLTTNGTGSLNLSTNNGTNSGTIQIAQGVNGNITLTPNGTGSVSVPKLVVSTATAGRVPYTSTGGLLVDSANLTFDGTTLTANALTTSSTVTLNGGTANGVAYLNGSKVLTTGSALTFDGSTLFTSRATDGLIFNARGTSAAQLLLNVNSGVLQYNSSNGSAVHAFLTNSVEQMRLTSTGLGIGTSSPTYKLDAQTTATGTAAGDNTVGYFGSLASGRDANIRFGDNVNASARIGYLSGALYIYTNGSERARIDSSGNLGLGVTPSAWSTVTALQVKNAAFFGIGETAYVANNTYFNNGLKYIASSGAGRYDIDAAAGGVHRWLSAPSGTAGNTISFNQAMTLDAGGNLGLGTTSPAVRFSAITSSDNSTVAVFSGPSGGTSRGLRIATGIIPAVSANNEIAILDAQSDQGRATMAFQTAGTERMRIDSSGNVGIGTTANASAILDAQSTTKGVRMPNMTTTQKNAIASPAAGLMVFDTTLAKLCVYTGAAWQTITSV